MMEVGDERLPERFWSKVQVSAKGCWEWTASRNIGGYGMGWRAPKWMLAHRIAYEAVHGSVPQGLEIDHLCRTRRCVNPAHLEAVTRRENVVRGMAATYARGAEFCRKGLHRITPDNAYTHPSGGERQCLQCMKAANLAWRTSDCPERKARKNASDRRYRAAHADKIQAYRAKYRAANRELLCAKQKVRNARNKELAEIRGEG